jgi:hypothetical protein
VTLGLVPVMFLAMSRHGAIILFDVRQDTLELACDACGRRGRYNVERLLAKHGDAKLIEVATAIATYPKARAFGVYDRCQVGWLPYRSKGQR